MDEGSVYYQGKVGEVKKVDPDLYDSWRKAIKIKGERRESESEVYVKHRYIFITTGDRDGRGFSLLPR